MKGLIPLTCALLSVFSYAQFTFTSIDYPGGNLTSTRGINNHGDIVGAYRVVAPRHALLIHAGRFIPLAPHTLLSNHASEAFKVDSNGDIVGSYTLNSGLSQGFVLSKGTLTTLTYPGASDTYARGITNTGTVVGYWDKLDSVGNVVAIHGFTWKNGSFTRVDFPGAADTTILGINAHGDFVGSWDSGINSPIAHGFICPHKQSCSSFDVPFAGAAVTQADDINSKGQIVGAWVDGSGAIHAFLMAGTNFTSFDFPGAASTLAWGINTGGKIVGDYVDAGGSTHGFLAKPSSVKTTEYAYSANLNQITGYSVNPANGALSSPTNVPGPNDAGGSVADPSGKFLYVSDFTGNAIDGFTINPANGTLTTINGSPFAVGSGNGPSGMAIDSAGKFLFLAHANLNGIFVFTRDSSTGFLTLVSGSPFPAGATTMHLAVHPSNNYLYASNLNDPMGSISAYTIDPSTGALTEIAGSPFATQAGFPGPSHLAIDPAGKFLYVGLGGTVNANHYVAAFTIDSSTGALTTIPGSPFSTGNGSFNVAVDHSGQYLYTANSFDNDVSAFTIDAATGALGPVSGSPFPTGALGGFPFALGLDPTGTFLYTANQASNNISGFSLNAATGVLTPVSGSPFSGIFNPYDLTIVMVP